MYFYKSNKLMIDFVISFISADIAIMLMQSMIIWLLYQNLGIHYVTIITLITLFSNSFVSKKYGYMLDEYSRTLSVIFCNIVMLVLIIIAIISSWSFVYIILSILSSIYFSIFYTARSAIAQSISNEHENSNFKKLNAILVVTDKIGAIIVGMIVAYLFKPFGDKFLLIISSIILLASIFMLYNFGDPSHSNKEEKSNAKIPQKNIKKDFSWFFSKPIAWIATFAIFITILIMLRNTINAVYLYDILKLTPDWVAYTSIAYNFMAILGGILVIWLYNEKLIIYGCFLLALITSLMIAIYPNFYMFIVSSLVFGFINSVNRIMYDSLIMKNIDNKEIATFYGFLNTINQSSQFFGVIAINLFLIILLKKPELSSYKDLVIWFYPAIFSIVPILWVFHQLFKKSEVKS